jgi:L-cystine uptake protein TcyP (sodium:dicarboxylate symporter family)
MLSQST